MSGTRRGFGDGSIDQRGPDTFRIRYWADGARHTKTVRGSKKDAQTELRRLLRSADTGAHVAPDKLTFAAWVDQWQQLRSRSIHRKSAERYEQVARLHLAPLGSRILQDIKPAEVEELIVALEEALAPRTVQLVFAVLSSLFSQAVRRDLIARNPMERVDPPAPADDTEPVGTVLEPPKIRELVEGFRDKGSMFPIVATLAYTGCRRNECLALRWSDLDAKGKKLTIARSLELSKEGYAFKSPKTERGKREIIIDDGLLGILLAERERYLRLVAGVADGDQVDVDLSLIKLPPDALMFPGRPRSGHRFDMAKPRHPEALTRMFMLHAASLGFPIRLHDLRGSHITMLLDGGIPPHVVAKRAGHSVTVMMKAYAQRTGSADERAAAVVAGFSSGLGS
jgi:integrase